MKILAQTTQPPPSNNIAGDIGSAFGNVFGGENLPLILTMGGILLVMQLLGGDKKQKLTTAHWAGRGEKASAIGKLCSEIEKRKVSEIGLYCGDWKRRKRSSIGTFFSGSPPTIPVCTVNRGVMVVGGAGCGKTFGVLNPLASAAIAQNLGFLLYDYKGEQKWVVATEALQNGYTNVRVFAPGKPYSCCINPIKDFIRSATDNFGAKQLAEVLYQNGSKDNSGGDPFFEPASQQLLQALIQLARATEYPDLAMCYALIQLSDLEKRLLEATRKREKYSPFLWYQFNQIASLAKEDAGKTTGGIIAGAYNLLQPLVQPQLMACTIGDSSIKTYIDDGMMLVIENDIARQDALAPVLAGTIHMIVLQNFAKQRQSGLVLMFDELPTIKVNVAQYAAEFRSKGCGTIIGFQNNKQLEQRYGKEGATIIQANMATKFFFNPGHVETAEEISKYLGESEITYSTQNVSHNFGTGAAGGSRSKNQSIQIVPLMSKEVLLKFKRSCVFINPAVGSSQEGSVPWHIQPEIKLPLPQVKRFQENEKMWQEKIEPRLIASEFKRLEITNYDELDERMAEEMNKRIALAEELLPLPEDSKSATTISSRRSNPLPIDI
ncbi:type IV secretory system conjugative DNA transfer family protein [Okeania sp. SIO2B3]|uniref:type IV secretory system conjugative DNA transfer family protein n=1 Tax=Okeania sp. SIO2B3 TaxID=2607784 RepID=UPI0013C26015|nr:type IV secretory system conjugative DNA transfer family protein [Okeania sp. SIO2B3]NET46948.1 type IV secretory system conjugative DNA transfer family protein [Okeania sp. SIO2B3]